MLTLWACNRILFVAIGLAMLTADVSPAKIPIVKEGRPPKVTPDMALRVAERFANGLPLNLALHLETPICPLAHWTKTLESSPKLSAIFTKRIAEIMQEMLKAIGESQLRQMPAYVWLLERRFPNEFGTQKIGNVTVNHTVIGLGQDILQRGQRLLRKQVQQAIDVASETQPGSGTGTKPKQ